MFESYNNVVDECAELMRAGSAFQAVVVFLDGTAES